MPYFTWIESDMTLQINKMDQEHKILIGIMNQLFDQSRSNACKQDLEKTIEKLVAFTVFHFRNEEAYMASIAYPQLLEHKKIHMGLLANLHDFISVFENSTGIISDQFLTFLKIWLSNHIMGADKKYAHYGNAGKILMKFNTSGTKD